MLWSSGHHYHSFIHSLTHIDILAQPLSLSQPWHVPLPPNTLSLSLSLEHVTNSVTQQLGPSKTLFLSLSLSHSLALNYSNLFTTFFFPTHLSTSLPFFFVPHTTFYYYSMPCYLIAITYSLITYYGSGFYNIFLYIKKKNFGRFKKVSFIGVLI